MLSVEPRYDRHPLCHCPGWSSSNEPTATPTPMRIVPLPSEGPQLPVRCLPALAVVVVVPEPDGTLIAAWLTDPGAAQTGRCRRCCAATSSVSCNPQRQ